MALMAIAAGISGGGPRLEKPGEFEIHFANVRGIQPDTNLTVRLTVEVARQLVDLINGHLPKGDDGA